MMHFKLDYAPFPAELQGYVIGFISSKEGRLPWVIIDSTRDTETQKKALRHELAHLSLNHCDTEADLEAMEREADALADSMTEADLEALLKWAI